MVLRFVKELRSFQQGRLYLLSIFPWIEALWISGTKVCGFFCGSATATTTTERFVEALRVNNVEILSVEDKAEENEDAFYVCKSSTSGGRLLT